MLQPAPLFQSPRALPAPLANPVLAIGNFDGMHRGHKALVEEALRVAHALGRPAGLLTFEPHPRAFMRPDEPFFRLTSLEDKCWIAGRLGLDLVVSLAFDATLRALEAERFVEEVLVRDLAVSGVVIGPNFRYGRGRAGDGESLATAGAAFGFRTCRLGPKTGPDGMIYSSSAIREALRRGDVSAAASMLGHCWFLRGTVQHGDKRGRELGFPTANMHLPASCGLAFGIYAVRAFIEGRRYEGVASFGRRPTFDNGEAKLETFLFGNPGDLYGQTFPVEFVARIRGEERFHSISALVEQMDRDVAAARAVFEVDPPKVGTSMFESA